jgi:hypothetical protein
MTSIGYILSRINLAWLTAPPLIILGVLTYDTYLFSQPVTARAVILAALLFYFLVETWPYRWALDIIILLVGISLIAQGIHHAQVVIRSVAHV